MMRKMVSGSWRSVGLQKPLSVLGILCVVILVVTFSKVNSFRSLLVSNSNYDEEKNTLAKKTLQMIIHKVQFRVDHIMKNNSSQSQSQLSFLADILGLIESVHESLPDAGKEEQEENDTRKTTALSRDDPEEHFVVEELRKYVKAKPNRLGKPNFMGSNETHTSVGHACFSAAIRGDLEKYMSYDIGDFCEDDWPAAQRLMLRGCDPLPRRRCLSRAPRLYSGPHPGPSGAWVAPDDRNVRWSRYKCKSFACLAGKIRNQTRRGFSKCAECFDFEAHEAARWVTPGNETDFLARDVIAAKPPGEIRIGLDFGVGTGSFAARMKELNVTVVTAVINLGAPFSEAVALRGFVPLYVTVNQRLPFFDNTLDLVHTSGFFDGWVDLVVLDFVLYDWDRVIRPGGLLWVDGFFCLREDLEGYLELFKGLRYKKHKWVVAPKLDRNDNELFFSALLEKPPRPFR